MNGYIDVLDNYKSFNKTARSNGAVFFGADWLSDIPLAELARDSGIDTAVYNRSVRGLHLCNAESVIENCVFELNPGKVFINIGENDIIIDELSENEFSERYEWLLYTLHSKCGCEIYILSVTNDKTGRVNRILKRIAERHGCVYIDIGSGCLSAVNLFLRIRFFLRSCPVTFFDAMNI